MSHLKKKLRVIVLGVPKNSKINSKRTDFTKDEEIRVLISDRIQLNLRDMFKKPSFNDKHGLAYKLLKTDKKRLEDSTLCSHDVQRWLRDFKNPSAAVWVLKLAGPKTGSISRNQILQWLKSNGKISEMRMVYNWTKKWGFNDTEYTKNIIVSAKSVEEARALYKETQFSTKESKRVFGNQLLKQLISDSTKYGIPKEDVFGFFKMLNKDIFTYQLMLAAMIKHSEYRVYRDQVWELIVKDEQANNIKIDTKLKDTNERVLKLISASKRSNRHNKTSQDSRIVSKIDKTATN